MRIRHSCKCLVFAPCGNCSVRPLNNYSSTQRAGPRRRPLARNRAVREFELEIHRPDGEVRTVLDTAYQRGDEVTGEVLYHGIPNDISERKVPERQLREAAIRDSSTGCYNRH